MLGDSDTTRPPVNGAPTDPAPAPEGYQDLALGTHHMATWELAFDTGALSWSSPLEGALSFDPHADPRWCEAVHPGVECDDFPRALVAPVATVAASSPWEDYELHHLGSGPDGERFELLLRARPVVEDGVTTGCIGVVVDVTERRDAERELGEMVERYRLLTELSPDGIAVHEFGRLVYANPSLVRFLGARSIDQLVGQPTTAFVHPASVAAMQERIARMAADADVSEPAEATLLRLDGSTIVVESTSVRTRWQGRPAFQVILRDLSERRRAEEVMRHQASLVAHVSDAIIGLDADGRIASWNPAAEAIYGWAPDEVVGQTLSEVVGDAGLADASTPAAATAAHRGRNGEEITVLMSLSPVRDINGAAVGAVAVCTDVTELSRAAAERRAVEARYAAVVSVLEEGIVVMDDDGEVTFANQAAEAILGRSVVGDGGGGGCIFACGGNAVREDGSSFPHEEHPAALALRTGAPQSSVTMGVPRLDGAVQWLSINARPLPREGSTGGIVCSFLDITDRRAAEKELEYRATHDELTGLPTRTLTLTFIDHALRRARRTGGNVALLFIDLDRFKLVNDTLGHLVGDEVLVAMARRVRARVRHADIVARLAGDEFVVLSEDVDCIEDAVALAQSISQVLTQPLDLESGRNLVVSASVGVAFAERGRGHAELLLSGADVAMYQAKERGRDRVEIFDERLRVRAVRRLDIEKDLRRAIDESELSVHYQPLVSLTTDRAVGVEALVRWRHPTRGIVGPDEFIPVAEDTGLMPRLGAWVLGQACGQMASWRRSLEPGAERLHVAVNLSARQLSDPELVKTVAAALEGSGLDPSGLYLEITESVLMDDAEAARVTLDALRGLGVRLAVDDFGTGYSSLAYLRRFPVNVLKIDRSFVAGIGTDVDDETVVQLVVDLAHSLKLDVVAEGVETKEQLETLRSLGCDMVQGYLLARPLPPDEVDLKL